MVTRVSDETLSRPVGTVYGPSRVRRVTVKARHLTPGDVVMGAHGFAFDAGITVESVNVYGGRDPFVDVFGTEGHGHFLTAHPADDIVIHRTYYV